MARKKQGGWSRFLVRPVPLGSLTGLGVIMTSGSELFLALPGADLLLGLSGGPFPLALVSGVGVAIVGRRLDRRGNARRELFRRVRANVAELMRVARADGIAAPQMKRIAGLQEGLLESWELLPEEYGPLLLEDLYTVVDEVETAAQLARRRSALRRHLESVDRRAIAGRIWELERELTELEEGSALRASFEAALEGRRGELAAHDEMPRAIGMINAQLEGIESLLGNLRGELLALDASPTALAAESGLVGLKQRISYFRRSLDEVKRSVDSLSSGPPDHLTGPLTERTPVR